MDCGADRGEAAIVLGGSVPLLIAGRLTGGTRNLFAPASRRDVEGDVVLDSWLSEHDATCEEPASSPDADVG